MKVKILTPTREPAAIEMAAPPRRGDHIQFTDDILEVKRVTWPVVEYFDGAGESVCEWVEIHCDRAEDVGDDWPPTPDVRVAPEPLTFPMNDPLGAAISRLIMDDPKWATQITARVGDQIFHLRRFTERLDQPLESEWMPAPDFSKYLPATTERN